MVADSGRKHQSTRSSFCAKPGRVLGTSPGGPPGGHTGGEVGAGGLLLCTGQLPSDQRGNQCYLGTLCLFMLKPISVAGFGGGIV